jgi:hypothetical protein
MTLKGPTIRKVVNRVLADYPDMQLVPRTGNFTRKDGGFAYESTDHYSSRQLSFHWLFDIEEDIRASIGDQEWSPGTYHSESGVDTEAKLERFIRAVVKDEAKWLEVSTRRAAPAPKKKAAKRKPAKKRGSIPTRSGETSVFEAHGKTLHVKRTKSRSWFLQVEGKTRGRFADSIGHARDDIRYFLEVGALPRAGVHVPSERGAAKQRVVNTIAGPMRAGGRGGQVPRSANAHVRSRDGGWILSVKDQNSRVIEALFTHKHDATAIQKALNEMTLAEAVRAMKGGAR